MKKLIREGVVVLSLLIKCEPSFAQDIGISLRLHYRSLISALFGVFGGNVFYLKAYLMLEHLGGWNVGIMGANIYRDQKSFTEDNIQDGQGSDENYHQRQYGLRLERSLSISDHSFYVTSEIYQARQTFAASEIYSQNDRNCFWSEKGKSSFDATTLSIGKRWDSGTGFLVMGEIGYKLSKDTTKANSSTVYNSCLEDHKRPEPDRLEAWNDLPDNRLRFGVYVGYEL